MNISTWTMVAGCLALLSADAGEAAPNVLFIVADDLNDALGCWGHPAVQTPNIDKLAKDSTRFRRAYAQASVCGPSRASFMTGRRPQEVGVLNNTDHFRKACPDLVTLPQMFRENGYYTSTSGKVFHHDQIWDKQSWDRCDPDWRFDEDLATFGESNDVTDGGLPWIKWKAVEVGTLWDDLVTTTVVGEIQRQEENRPFFIAAGLMRPHDPFFAPKEFFDLYPLSQIELPETAERNDWPIESYGAPRWMKHYEKLDLIERKELIRAWYACISFMDAQVGRMLDALESAGLHEDTIVVFLSDHGYHNWEKGWWGKTTVWERSALAPLMIRVPGELEGSDVMRIVELVDVYPTLAELAGIKAPKRLSGRSLAPLMMDPLMSDSEWKGEAFTQFERNLWSVRNERFRYCEWGMEGKRTTALYCLETDPDELHDLSSESEQDALIKGFQERLSEQRKLEPGGDQNE